MKKLVCNCGSEFYDADCFAAHVRSCGKAMKKRIVQLETYKSALFREVDKRDKSIDARGDLIQALMQERSSLEQAVEQQQQRITELESIRDRYNAARHRQIALRKKLMADIKQRDDRIADLEAWKQLHDAAPAEAQPIVAQRMLDADAIQPFIASWKARVAELEAALREIADCICLDRSWYQQIANKALKGGK